jgi:hypothetical protein
VLAAVLVAGCTSTQGRFAPVKERYPPLASNQTIDVLDGERPTRPFMAVARLDAHLEKAGLMTSSLDEALVELKKQARLAGADAIIDIREQRSRINETRVLHVTATGIRYTDRP